MTLVAPITDDRRQPASHSGDGVVEVSLIAGRSVVTRCTARSPLKLLTPRARNPASWIYTSTYGGGLVGGDEVRLKVGIGPGATCLLATQSSTKIYPRRAGQGCRQSLDLTIGAGGLAVVAPDPLVCFAGAEFVQRQRFDLAAGAGLVLVEALASGRRARGERWAMNRYSSRTDMFVDGRHVFRDALLLDPKDGPLCGIHRMGRFDCIATIVLIGEPLNDAIIALAREVDSPVFVRAAPGPFSASPIAGGLLLRVVGDGPEAVGRWIRKTLTCVPSLLEEDPWARKW